MNDNELITLVRDSLADIHSASGVASIISRGRAVRARQRIPAMAGVLAVTAGAALTAAALAPSGSATPAYALTTHPDGTVTLAVYRASGISQADAKLRQLGDDVVVVPVAPGCPELGSLSPPDVAPNVPMTVYATKSGDGSITVNAQGVPDGDIMVVGVQTTARDTQMSAQLTSPPPPSCVTLPAGSSGPASQQGHGQ
jgi:hypothetical protein